jgi:hypothetical protein
MDRPINKKLFTVRRKKSKMYILLYFNYTYLFSKMDKKYHYLYISIRKYMIKIHEKNECELRFKQDENNKKIIK